MSRILPRSALVARRFHQAPVHELINKTLSLKQDSFTHNHDVIVERSVEMGRKPEHQPKVGAARGLGEHAVMDLLRGPVEKRQDHWRSLKFTPFGNPSKLGNSAKSGNCSYFRYL
ncbi:hypothetical protein R3P38DRAFT_2778523 [Favolaschia claudopus]|uniref:Uncharacterized protein n=1 Tax=Favolaschia claudopus TaxID=2862362 RepID=A0AAW0BHF5_9AGAR